MIDTTLAPIIPGNRQAVKPPGGNNSPTSPMPVILHKAIHHSKKIIMSPNMRTVNSHYAVSPVNRGITIGVLNKRHERIRELLASQLGLTQCQRECAFRLLRLWTYYGKVYPKAGQLADRPGCSRATFFRTVRILEDLGLIRVVNRFLVRERAQISNLYLLHNLALVIARYLAEHGVSFPASWLSRYLTMPGSTFWYLFNLGALTVFDEPAPV